MKKSVSLTRRFVLATGVTLGAAAAAVVVVALVVSPTSGSIAALDLPSRAAVPPDAAGEPLWQAWHPPADLASAGRIGSVHIPPTASGFAARDAEVYLPPAALVPNPPLLPFVLMMMGQPGDPDAGPIAQVLDQFAATHNGLAPIVVVADQLGDPDVDSLCLDTPRYGNVQTYIEQDVVDWAVANLGILSGRDQWTVAGFSNGGQCAISLAAKFPGVWGNVISASGTTYAGVETESDVLADVFDGDQQAYDASKPETAMADTPYPDTSAVFTVGADDDFIGPGFRDLSEKARAAGMTTTTYEVPGEGHTTEALTQGLQRAFDTLAPRLSLVPPAERR
ncbi:esterase family protein [Cryobacterium sp. MLB-32]|uniref:alpha/beta hydrolase n=1 Tax=Cryobacterium sp. MLB-32 TaxID=1529318 RepID=UPI000689A3E4|nr:alpha/beta hydrolase-fold protein [Cryobacterium sp. MLB-32]